MIVQAKTMLFDEQKEKFVDSLTSNDANCARFASYLTQNMGKFCKLYPSFQKLKDAMALWFLCNQTLKEYKNGPIQQEYFRTKHFRDDYLAQRKEPFGEFEAPSLRNEIEDNSRI